MPVLPVWPFLTVPGQWPMSEPTMFGPSMTVGVGRGVTIGVGVRVGLGVGLGSASGSRSRSGAGTRRRDGRGGLGRRRRDHIAGARRDGDGEPERGERGPTPRKNRRAGRSGAASCPLYDAGARTACRPSVAGANWRRSATARGVEHRSRRSRARRFGTLPLRVRGAIAQLEERLNGIQKVRGSNPRSSTNPPPGPAGGSVSEGQPTVTATDKNRSTTATPAGRPERTRLERYDATEIEPRWQARWDELGLYETDLHDESRPKSYILTMYPYPSGDLHIGHWYIVTPTDALARFHRMHGENVFFPIGFDAFGLPAENAAIKNNINPRDWTMQNIEHERKQFRSMGAVFDWRYELVTCEPEFYRWNQWLFLRFLEAGLAYRRKSPVDWCPNDGTLAREQVEGVDRHCWRCGAPVEKRDLEQWYLRTTKYADELLDFSGIDWPEPIRLQQTNWIGRSEGAEVVFTTAPDDHQPGGDELRVFTTRPGHAVRRDVHGAGARASARREADRPDRRDRGRAPTSPRRRADRDRAAVDRSREDRRLLGADAINPVNGERIPIWIADYVLAGYGTGAIMAVPAHDERDFAFATRFGLPIRRVVAPAGTADDAPLDDAYVAHTPGERLVNSGRFSGMPAPRGGARHRGLAGRGRPGEGHGHVPAARLVIQPPALLGHADPGHLLRARRDRARARRGPAGPAARHGRLRRPRREPAEPRRGVPARRLPALRRARPPRDRHDGHVRRLLVVLVPLPVAAQGRRGRSTARSSTAGRRSTSTPAAPSTPSCTSCTAGSGRRRCATSASSPRTSRSSGCSTRARSWAPTASG